MTDHLKETFRSIEKEFEDICGEFRSAPRPAPVSRLDAIAAMLFGDSVMVEKDGVRRTGYRWRGTLYVVTAQEGKKL